jgi:virginiamycin B lyase
VQGPSGILYFTTNNPGLGRITTDGVVLDFVAPVNNLANGGGIAARGNAIWYTDFNNDSLWRYDVPSEQFTEFPVPTPGTDPLDVAVASDGKVWFSGGDAIGSLDPSTNEVRQFATLNPNAGPLDIASAPTGGSVWFTQTLTGNVARATPAGVITEGKAVRNSDPFRITIGPGDNPWYTMSSANKIARLTLN